MTGAGERVASSSRCTASGCSDRSAATIRAVAPLGQQPLGARVVGDDRVLVDARRGEGERDGHAGAVLADRAVHQHGLIGDDPADDLDHAGPPSPRPAAGTSRRGAMSSSKNDATEPRNSGTRCVTTSRPSTRLGACATSSSARRSMMRRMPRAPSAVDSRVVELREVARAVEHARRACAPAPARQPARRRGS